MRFFKNSNKRAVGLDIGSGSIKALELRDYQSNISIANCRKLKLRAEGILDEEELSGSLSAWLDQADWRDLDICVGLPQYLSTVQVRDFPPVSEDALKDMIAYETAQLAGISEESFIHDYHVMPPKFGRKNPVLIGISRLSVVSERLKILDKALVTPSDIAMNSTASINALFHLHPETRNVDSLQLLLDIGAENSIVVIFAGGQILSISSLFFGAEKFTKAVAENKGLDLTKAEEEKSALKVDFTKKDEALSRVAANLVAELNNAIEQWRQHESGDFLNKELVKIWLCGGGAETGGLQDFIRLSFRGTQVELFGPKDAKKIQQPDLTAAFGLALQALGRATVKISLSPEHIRWTARLKKNFQYLSTAVFFILLSIFFILGSLYLDLQIKDSLSRKAIMRLSKSAELIPEINKVSQEIAHHEKMILPVVAKANNAAKILAVLNQISQAKNPNLYPIFICDEHSYESWRGLDKNSSSADSKLSFLSNPKQILSNSENIAANQAVQLNVSQVKEINSLILYGFTLSLGKNEHFENVRKFQTALAKSNIFAGDDKGLDVLPDDNSPVKEKIISFWNTRVINNKEVYASLGRNRFRGFGMKLPFNESSINLSSLSSQPKDKK